MANISDNTNLNGHVDLATNGKQNWISQINAGGTVYDIATHHGITFKDGNNGEATVWNGLTDLEVVIPSITDIVQTPIEFAGTVTDGNVSWNDTHNDGPQEGYLVFVTNDCTFDGKAVEAGDMAIYAGKKWNIVSGENQVQLAGETDSNNKLTIAVGSAKDVLTVEGKTLALTLDYAELDKHVELTKGGVVKADLSKLSVDSTFVTLTKGDDTTLTIGSDVTLKKADKLADGTVKLENAGALVNNVIFGEVTGGEFPSLTFNNAEKKLDVDGGSLTSIEGTDFVKTVTMASDKKAIIVADNDNDAEFKAITSLTAVSGASFLSGIHATEEGEKVDLVIPGHLTTEVSDVKFVSGIEGDKQAVVTGFATEGDVKLADDTKKVVTGFGTESDSGDVISSVNLTADSTSVLSSAYVEENTHVLTFGSVNVASNVSATYGYKSLATQDLVYTAPTLAAASFVTSGFIKDSDINYTFVTGQETTYTTDSGKWKFNSDALNVTTGAYQINHGTMKATIPANTYAVNTTGGSFPVLTGASFTTTAVTGSVKTDLTYVDVTVHALASDKMSITLPGVYELSTTATATSGAIEVGKAGAMKTGSEVSVSLANYITDVTISTSTTNVTPQE